jgi:hypothetical protein
LFFKNSNDSLIGWLIRWLIRGNGGFDKLNRRRNESTNHPNQFDSTFRLC